jgi:UPF0716 protein FxsA
MNVAKWLMLALLMLPLAELAAFVAVAAAIGFLYALAALLAGSLAGVLILRHAGGNHIARVRMAVAQGFEQGRLSALRVDGTGGLVLLGGVLLLVPGFITGFLGCLVLIAVAWRQLNVAVGRTPRRSSSPVDGVVDLEPEQWRRVDDPKLPDGRPGDNGR